MNNQVLAHLKAVTCRDISVVRFCEFLENRNTLHVQSLIHRLRNIPDFKESLTIPKRVKGSDVSVDGFSQGLPGSLRTLEGCSGWADSKMNMVLSSVPFASGAGHQ